MRLVLKTVSDKYNNKFAVGKNQFADFAVFCIRDHYLHDFLCRRRRHRNHNFKSVCSSRLLLFQGHSADEYDLDVLDALRIRVIGANMVIALVQSACSPLSSIVRVHSESLLGLPFSASTVKQNSLFQKKMR